ncbi:uncharacterized protein Dwil_GK10544 [Drosophila willistoni]|uniref:Enhancer of split malpha protein n=1 Tax=Drosophila willistoni TaxID=7260 RepID=B4NM06_DROWI|nr:enhancer of split malpha protein [Drosophila willistoni]EDW85374.1 uncharacterized protein Dwil_GK10544 [Drosophila willistoni]
MSFKTQEYKFDCSQMMQHKSGQHTMAMRSLKKLVKPLLRLVKKKELLRKTLAEVQTQNNINASLEDMRKDPAASCDNMANEQLEQRLYNELRQCSSNMAMIVRQGQQQQVVPIHPEHTFIPVHFARTTSGTFFWTTAHQQEQKLRQQYDRWVQA